MPVPENLEGTVLLPRAFEPALLPVIDTNWCAHVLYQGELPEYALEGLRGTIKPKKEGDLEDESNTFSEAEKVILEKFNGQFRLLIKNILSQCAALQIRPDYVENLTHFREYYCSRTFYINQSFHFYTQIKQSLEVIAYNLTTNTLLNDAEKKYIMEDMLSEIANCGPGVYRHVETAKINISSDETIPAWLARFRLRIIKNLASIKSPGDPHVEQLYLIHANQFEWNPYGFEKVSAVQETHVNLSYLSTEENLKKFRTDFFILYNPITIITELATTLHQRITERFRKKRAESNKEENEKQDAPENILTLTGSPAFADFFAGIPINHNGLEISDIFNESHDSTLESFIYTDIPLSLKSVLELIQSMTTAFALKGTNFFETYCNDNYTLVADYPDLCYQHSSEEKPPLESTQNALEWIKTKNVPLNHNLFMMFYQDGIRDFSHCILDAIDFSPCDMEILRFENATFYNQEVTLCQFIFLFKCKARVLQFVEKKVTDDKLFNEIGTILETSSPADKGILLFYAVPLNKSELIALLLQAGADASEQSSYGFTAMHVAALLKNWECVKAFAKEKPDKNNAYQYGAALTLAAATNQWDVVQILIKANAFPNWHVLDHDNQTALHFAILENKADMVQMLLNAGADASLQDSNGHTAIQIAAVGRKWECVKAFATQKTDANDSSRYDSVLLMAAKMNLLDVVKILINDAGASLRQGDQNDYNRTALHFAAYHNNVDMARVLINAGFDASLQDSEGRTAIDIAANLGNWNYIKAASTMKKSDKNDSLHYGRALAIAVHRNQPDVVKVLINAYAPIHWHARAHNNQTPLHFAAIKNNVAMVQMLLAAGANAQLQDSDGKTALDLATEKNYQECARTLSTHSNSPGLKQLYIRLNYRFSPDIERSLKTAFLNFYTALENDSSTAQETKDIINNHFSSLVASEDNHTIIQKILCSKNDLQKKLKGNPPMSPALQTALGVFFGALTCILIAGSGALFADTGLGMMALGGATFFYRGYKKKEEYYKKEQQKKELIENIFPKLNLAPS